MKTKLSIIFCICIIKFEMGNCQQVSLNCLIKNAYYIAPSGNTNTTIYFIKDYSLGFINSQDRCDDQLHNLIVCSADSIDKLLRQNKDDKILLSRLNVIEVNDKAMKIGVFIYNINYKQWEANIYTLDSETIITLNFDHTLNTWVII